MKPQQTPASSAVTNAFGAPVNPLPAGLELVHLTVKDSEGKDVKVDKTLHKDVLSIISKGMTLSNRLETHWKDNADRIILEFFGEDPFSGSSAEAMMSEFRASDEIGIMYAVFQRQHPEMARAERNKARSTDPKLSKDDQKDAADAFDKIIRTIRATAMNQAIKVCRYYVEAHAVKGPAEERQQETAMGLIEDAIREWSKRTEQKRGNFKLDAELKVLNGAIDVLREYKIEVLKARKETLPTSTLDLSKPEGKPDDENGKGKPATPRDRSAEKAGPVSITKPTAEGTTK